MTLLGWLGRKTATQTNTHIIWASISAHDKTNKMACVPSKDSDQPGHLPSLIRVFTVCMKKPWVLSYPLSAQQILWSDWADAQANLSFRWAHMPFCWFCHVYHDSSKICSTNVWLTFFHWFYSHLPDLPNIFRLTYLSKPCRPGPSCSKLRQRCKIPSKLTRPYGLNFHLDAKNEEKVKKVLKISLVLP